MPIIKTLGLTSSVDRASGETDVQFLLYLPKNKDEVGCLLTADFSTEHLYNEDADYLGVDYSLVAEIRKGKHAFIVSDVNGQNQETFVDVNELFEIEYVKNTSYDPDTVYKRAPDADNEDVYQNIVDSAGKFDTIYQIPFDPDEYDNFKGVIEDAGIQNVLSWFDTGSFDTVFRELCKSLGKEPDPFIHKLNN